MTQVKCTKCGTLWSYYWPPQCPNCKSIAYRLPSPEVWPGTVKFVPSFPGKTYTSDPNPTGRRNLTTGD